MGVYLHPEAPTLRGWLSENCRSGSSSPPLWEDIPAGTRLVCYTVTEGIAVAAVMFDEMEYKRFTNPAAVGFHANNWYIVPVEALREAGMRDVDLEPTY